VAKCLRGVSVFALVIGILIWHVFVDRNAAPILVAYQDWRQDPWYSGPVAHTGLERPPGRMDRRNK